MKNICLFLIILLFTPSFLSQAQIKPHAAAAWKESENLKITRASVAYQEDLDLMVFTIMVAGKAGATRPEAFGQLDGAPVLGYVFPTSLKSTDVGFGAVEGIVALALTSHPDFDDTPLWDENSDQILDNDGLVWHPHWVILQKDDRVKGGLSVKQFEPKDQSVKLPPTNPGMPMYMDSPGYPVLTRGKQIQVIVPAYRINHQKNFKFDGVTAYMQVNTSQKDQPMLGVYEVYDIASEDLSLPYQVEQ